MSDEWLRKAEEQRAQDERKQGDSEAEREAANEQFFHTNKDALKGILQQVGQMWKSLDPHRTVLGIIPIHIGNDYAVKVDYYKSPNSTSPHSVALWLFDKKNWTLKYFGSRGTIGLLSPSVEVQVKDIHFVVEFRDGLKLADSLETVKSLIADEWAKRKITVSKY